MRFTSGSLPHREPGDRAVPFGSPLGTIVALAAVQTVLTVAVAVLAPKEAQAPLDERERLIDLEATRFAYGARAGLWVRSAMKSGGCASKTGRMTQQQLADNSPTLEAAFRIAAVLGKPLESVFHYSKDD